MLNSINFLMRPMSMEDINLVRNWRNQTHVKRYMFTDTPITNKEHNEWFINTLNNKSVDYQIISYKNQPIGLANAVDINSVKKSCYWGFYLGKKNLPKGCGSQLATLMLSHIFNTYNVNTIFGEVFEFNNASLKLHDRFGFTQEENQSKTVTKNNRQENVIVLSLQRDDWNKNN